MACSPRGHNVRDVRQADRRSIEFAVDGAEQIAQLEQPDSLGMVSMSAMSAADAMRGGAVILPLFLLRPLDRPLDQLRIFDPTKPPRIVELVAQVDMQAQCLGLCRKRLSAFSNVWMDGPELVRGPVCANDGSATARKAMPASNVVANVRIISCTSSVWLGFRTMPGVSSLLRRGTVCLVNAAIIAAFPSDHQGAAEVVLASLAPSPSRFALRPQPRDGIGRRNAGKDDHLVAVAIVVVILRQTLSKSRGVFAIAPSVIDHADFPVQPQRMTERKLPVSLRVTTQPLIVAA
jgi:hypothetical protein